ncbi:IS5 family transposase [Paenibacillus larvae]|nr:IS5 family transposase [Paenibacillus larvae]MDT2239330.1 IS5 family transposase [Paenibacillus larvae]
MEKRYEIRDDQWEKIKDLLPPERKPQGGRIAKDNRMMLNAMLWVARSGAPWRDLPEHYGSWKTVYTRFRRWQMAGIWDEILKQVSVSPDLENIMIDATIVASISMGRAQRGQQFQDIGHSRGGITTKIHAIVDALGIIQEFKSLIGKHYDNDTVQAYIEFLELKTFRLFPHDPAR